MPEFKTFADFLSWVLTGPGVVMLSGAFISLVLAKFKFWNGLNGDLKTLVVFALPFLIFIPAVFAGLHFSLIVKDDILNKIFTVILYLVSNQYTYTKLKAANMLRLPSPVKK